MLGIVSDQSDVESKMQIKTITMGVFCSNSFDFNFTLDIYIAQKNVPKISKTASWFIYS